MGNFDLDLTNVQKVVYKDRDKIPVRGNEHRMIRVAFDLFHLKGDEQEDLWQIQADDDGEFLVRTYSLPDEEQVAISDWNAKEDKKQANLTITYKGIPIQRLAASDYGAQSPEDVAVLRGVVLKKLAQDKGFAVDLFNTLSSEKKEILKEAGFIKSLREWLTGQDITDEVMEKIMKVVNEQGPPYKKNCPAEKKEEQDADYQEYFQEKAEEFDAPSGDPQDVPVEKRKEFFEEVDKGWQAENECGEDISMSLAALELELQLKEAETTDFPPELQFDVTDVEAGQGEWEPEEEMEAEPAGSFHIDEGELEKIIQEVERLNTQKA